MTKTEAVSLAKQQAEKRRERMYVVLSKHYVKCYGEEEGYDAVPFYDLNRWHQGESIEYIAEHKPQLAAEGGRDE